MRSNDFQPASKVFSNAAAGTSPQFELRGGKYALDVAATGSAGTVVLNKLGPDGVTFIPVLPLTTALTQTGSAIYDLSPGQYTVTVATLTAIFVSITEIQIGA